MSRKNTEKPCINPLFLSWLEKWRDEAKEKGLNAQWTFEKAITSLKKYPLPLRSGKEAKILENIGDGIAKKLDKALEEFIQNGGDISIMHAIPKPSTTISKPCDKRVHQSVQGAPKMSLPTSRGSGSQTDGNEPEAKKRKREYLPKQRSGPFALLLTLYRESQDVDFKGHLTKDELQTKAEPLIEKSFSKAEPGSHYTPWSSMTTLINKGFVLKSSNPAKFSLTDEGIRLGQKLDEIEKQNPSFKPPEIRTINLENQQQLQQSSLSSQKTQNLYSSPLQHRILHRSSENSKSSSPLHQQIDIPAKQPAKTKIIRHNLNYSSSTATYRPMTLTESKTPSLPNAASDQDLCYWYVENTGNLTSIKGNAVVKLEGNNVWFLIKCDEDNLKRCNVTYKIDKSRPKERNFIFAFLSNRDAKDVCTTPKIITAMSADSSLSINTGPPRIHKSQSWSKSECEIVSIDKVIPQKNVASQSSTVSRIPESSEMNRTDPHDVTCDSSKQLFTMDPGSFEVVLCVDQMEVVGGANTNSKRMMLDQLKRMNVKMDVRKLQLGDFLWIAREKFPLGGKKREVVLDFIVERKRMDDLAGSIVDGRFKEQKFRLKSCGLKHLIYLIESYGSLQHMVLPEATLKQAIVNSQVVDGLFIRQTGSIYESAAYLTRLTQHLQCFYQGKTLKSFPVDHVKKVKEDRTFNEIIQNDVQCMMTFGDFYETTNKNKMLSVKEMFAKHLMQLKGISSEKAAAIVDAYETPKRLINALEACVSEDDKENLLSDIAFGNTRRKIGPMLAKQICMLYSSKRPLT